MAPLMPFAGNPFHRAGNERRDPEWLAAAFADERSRFLPMLRLKVPVRVVGQGADAGAIPSRSEAPSDGAAAGGGRPGSIPESPANGGRCLAWVRAGEWIEEAAPPVLLGMQGEGARFAVDVSAAPDPAAACGFGAGTEFQGLRTAAPHLSTGDAAIAAEARALLGWHERHPFCAACGNPTETRHGGSSRRCPSCGTEHFPRTDPVVIVVVARGDRALLGRSGRFPGNLYSALAGFMEAGESIEEAVRREVAEEAGIEVGEVHYVASQPWPFPASLMIGCLAEGLSEEIVLDREELADAKWFSRSDILEALAGRSDRLSVPGPIAIAHHLIRAWLAAR